jgi:hypothetical protein
VEGKMCAGGSCGYGFFIVLAATVEKMLQWRIRAVGKVVGLDVLHKLRMRWAGWALKWHLFYSFSFLILVVVMAWMGHYISFFFFFFSFFSFFIFSLILLYIFYTYVPPRKTPRHT